MRKTIVQGKLYPFCAFTLNLIKMQIPSVKVHNVFRIYIVWRLSQASVAALLILEKERKKTSG